MQRLQWLMRGRRPLPSFWRRRRPKRRRWTDVVHPIESNCCRPPGPAGEIERREDAVIQKEGLLVAEDRIEKKIAELSKIRVDVKR